MSAAAGPPAIRVVLCDDQDAMRAAFRSILEHAGFEVVGEASDGDQAIVVVRQQQPDVVLMDVRMPGRDGISATAEIVAVDGHCSVLVLTTFDDDDVLFGALGAGAAGFMLKNAGPEEVVGAVQRVAGGDAVLDPSVARRVFARFASGRADGPHATEIELDRGRSVLDSLTERERDVLWLLAQGMTNVELAARLGIGEATAKTHVSRVLAKLGVRDRVQAVIRAYETGFAAAERPLG